MSASNASKTGTGRVLRVLAIIAVPTAALFAAWWFTRVTATTPTASVAAAIDDSTMQGMAGMPGMGESASKTGPAAPVMLSRDQMRRIGVTFAPVTADPLSRSIRTVGQISFDETRVSTITTKLDGWVEQLFVDYTGRAVQRGEPLMRIYSPMVVTAQEELLLSRRLAADVATGNASGNASGNAETRANAEDLLASARRRLANWDVSADAIATLERTGQVQRTVALTASSGGVVLEKNVSRGQRIMAGDVLYRLADLGSVWLVGDVYEQDLRAVHVGQRVSIEVDAYPGEKWNGRVTFIAPTISAETRTARVRVAIANPGLRLKPGLYATLHIETTQGIARADRVRAPMLTVPRGAVLSTGARSLVFVRLANGLLEPRTVTLGASTDERIQILHGVAVGDTVVASATFLLDAESNLGTALGGMGDMPGMEITTPPSRGASKGSADAAKPKSPRRER